LLARDSAPALVWFRNDLRLADNEALLRAAQAHGAVLPVFIWSPEEEASWSPGAASNWWLHQSLQALDKSLAALGSKLIVRRAPAVEGLLDLVRDSGAKAVYWNRRYEPALIARDRTIKTCLRDAGLTAESLAGNLLFEPWDIRNRAGKPFQVFTPFWRAYQAASAPPQPRPAPATLPRPTAWPNSLAIADLELEPKVDWAGGLRESWIPGEQGAAQALESFLRAAASHYPAGRDQPGTRCTSRLSPHLRFGEISVRQVWHSAGGHEAFLRQLVWREFAYHLLYHFPSTTTQPLRADFRAFPWRMDNHAFHAWTNGQTGYPLVDAGMRELWHTGWMHNRVRMIVGSFLVKHLLIPWQEGAAWFWDTLVDADLANNTLGWQWIAGCGADAAPYFRIFNPVLQGEKFDPHGHYVRHWVPELADLPDQWVHRPWEAPHALRGDYRKPIVEHEAARARALAALAQVKAI